MKKYGLFLSVIMLLAVILLTGCTYNAHISTDLIINSDGSGQRIMSWQRTDEAELSSVTDEDISKALTKAVADGQLALGQTVDGFYLQLDFSSVEDYKSKVSTIFSQSDPDFIPEISITTGEAASVYENFSSGDLLAGVIKNCAEQIKTDSSQDAELTVENDSSTVTINKMTVSVQSDNIACTFNQPAPAGQFELLITSTALDREKLSRTVELVFADSDAETAMEQSAAPYSERADGLPNASTSWEDNSLKIYFEGNAQEIAQCTEELLGCTDELSYDPGMDSDSLTEYIMLSETITFDESTELTYRISNDEYYAVSDISGAVNGDVAATEKDGGNWDIFADVGTLQVNCEIEYRDYADTAAVILTNLGSGRYSREYRFGFIDSNPNFLNALADSLNKNVSQELCTAQKDELVVRFEGDIDFINQTAAAIFGSENILSVESSGSAFSLSGSRRVSDSIMLSADVYLSGRTGDIAYSYIPYDGERIADQIPGSVVNSATVSFDCTVSNQYSLMLLVACCLAVIILFVLMLLLIKRRSIKKQAKTVIPPGGYLTSQGVVVLPSSMAQQPKETANK